MNEDTVPISSPSAIQVREQIQCAICRCFFSPDDHPLWCPHCRDVDLDGNRMTRGRIHARPSRWME
jgi:Zn finger protein HypA/HybF involved in hydrogenase expression